MFERQAEPNNVSELLSRFWRMAFCLIGFWLVFASIPHLQNPYLFLGSIMSYEMLGPSAATFLAGILPIVQLTVGICLIFDLFSAASQLLCLALFTMFFAAQTYLRFVLGKTDCGCFGLQQESLSFLESYSYYLVLMTLFVCVSRFIFLMKRRYSFYSWST
ncbi:MAG: MauE/DoxX family redox-associated membrane protein [Mariniblastus sp.]